MYLFIRNSRIIKLAILVFVFTFLIGASILSTWRLTLSKLTIKSVTPNQIANAMKNDSFYSTYDENTLMVRGQISTISKQGKDLVIGLKSNSSFKLLCDLGNVSLNLQIGNKVTVFAEGATAERQPNAVLLKNSVELSS